ncbi:MAG TPA: hypothetical protein VGM19_00155 [Armatimonadota bacterium]|jgi:hypothetical protein
MSRTETLLRERPALLVSLPRNELVLAEAALEGGADGLKVHLNVVHHASGTYFGPWAEEGETIRRILALGAPVGMVPGTAAQMITPAEAAEIEAAGVDFVDAYLQDMPAWLPAQLTRTAVMGALSWTDGPEWSLGSLAGRCALLEASVVRPEEYGSPLAEADLAAYREIHARHPELPAIVPSQRALRPAQVESILATGMRGILIGAIVTGKTAEGIRETTARFAEALG